MSETPRTDALRKLFHEMYEFDDSGIEHHLFEKYADLECELSALKAQLSAVTVERDEAKLRESFLENILATAVRPDAYKIVKQRAEQAEAKLAAALDAVRTVKLWLYPMQHDDWREANAAIIAEAEKERK